MNIVEGRREVRILSF